MKRVIALGLAVLMAFAVVGCGDKANTTDENKVTWHMMFQQQDDLEAVEAEINKVIKEEIGTELDIVRIDPADYTQKMQVMFAAGEDMDLCWMSPGTGYSSFVEKGALLPMNDLIAKYAPKSYAAVPEKFWDAARVKGEIYGFLNYQIVGRQFGFVMQQDMLDEANFDLDSLEKFEDIEPLLKHIHDNHPDYIAYGRFTNSAYENFFADYNMEEITRGVGFRTNNDKIEVINLFAQQEYQDLCNLMRDWYEKGYIEQDAATISNSLDLRKKGIVKAWQDMTGPGFEPTFESGCGGRAVKTKTMIPPVVTSANIIATMNSIAKTSKSPEKAMQILELVNQNVGDIYNMLCFGLEGQHYNKTGENRIELIENSGYYPNIAWAWGNQFNAYLMPGQADDLWEQTMALNESATQSKLLGFLFDTEPVKTEISQMAAVISQYDALLGTGTVSVADKYDEFMDKLEVAGVNTVVAEAQRQIDAWLAENAQ